jgi:ABC-type uncharacterized transport system permease subunit
MLDNILSSLVVLLYLSLAVMFAHRLISKSDSPPKKTLLAIGLVTVVAHTYLVIGNLYTATGLDLSFFTVSSLVALVVTAMLLSASWREPIESLAIVVLPIAALAVLLRTTSEQSNHLTSALPFGLELHIVFSIVAYSLLSLAALQSIFLYIHDAHLHNKHPGGFIRALPPLQTMERLLFRLIAVGFVILSASLVSGIFYIEDILGQHLVHKTVLSAGAWMLFAVLLLGRRIFGWRGRIAIRWTLTGFALLLLAYFGSKFVIELVLQR